MHPTDFTESRWGRLAPIPNDQWAFVPSALPPKLEITWDLVARLSLADRSLAELSGIARNLPNPHLLIRPFIRREAVLSSRIEGTEASLSDLLLFEAAQVSSRSEPPDVRDVKEVSNYVVALDHGMGRLRELPMSLRLIREMHEKLMRGVRGERLTPGEFRRTQNWIGRAGSGLADATYVPPPVPEMAQALDELEGFLQRPTMLPPLIRLALVHYQFEAIHPFLDGNGRIGRLLITLLLCHEGLLAQPLLYLSAYFERNRAEYYRQLLAVSQRGEWPAWIDFFLAGVAEQSKDAVWRVGRLLDLRGEYRARLETARTPATLFRLVDDLFERPAVTVRMVAKRLKVTHRTAGLGIGKLVKAGILREVTGRQRHRVFVARGILDALEQAMPPSDGGGA